MNENLIPKDYANTLIYELQKAFWDERGKGARFRMTTVGSEFYQENVRSLIRSDEVEEIIQSIAQVLTEKGIVSQVRFSQEDRLFRVSVKGCIHRNVEERMITKGIEPFTCIPANLMVLAIEERLDRPVELAEIKIEEGECHLLLILFDKRPSLD